jgi:pyridoxal 5'-phosphate synthase pdxS subunit
MKREMVIEELRHGTELVKRGFASLQKGGVIMDVTSPEQALVAEEAGAIAVMALHAVPADIRKAGGVARMADPAIIAAIIDAVTIPVMAKCRIGHFVEAQILEALGVDMIDESEVLTPVDTHHVDKRGFTVPFVCGARDLGEALRRIEEGAAMIRTKGEAGTGDVKEAVRHMKLIMGEIRSLDGKNEEELRDAAKELKVSFELVQETAQLQRLPVVNFAAGGVATPADAALMMQLGADGVFVGSGIFKSENPPRMASAIVEAVNNYDDAKKLAELSKGLGLPMKGIEVSALAEGEMLQVRGW